MTSWITICAGCKRADWGERSMDKTDGEAFAEMIEAAAQPAGINTRRVTCTMGCERACNVIVQSAGKISYSLGMFDATPSDAQAIVDYAVMHSESETGQVPFRQWPIGVKGHFVSRHIPLPEQN